MWYVYKHTRLDNNTIFYIGIGCTAKYKRAYTKSGRNGYWYNIARKVNYLVEILFDNLSQEEANSKEIELIAFYKRTIDGGTLCNLALGGDGCPGYKHTEDHKKKILTWTQGVLFSEARRKAIGDAHRGKIISEAQRKKCSDFNKGKKISEKIKEKMRAGAAKNLMVLDITTGIYYDSITEVARTFNLNRRSLSKTIRQAKTNYTNFRTV